MKYILYEVKVGVGKYAPGTELAVRSLPFIFAEALVHADMDKHFQHALMWQFNGDADIKAVAAGFYNPITGDCYGVSETMGLGTHPNTSNVVRMSQYGATLDKPLSIPQQLEVMRLAALEKLNTNQTPRCPSCDRAVGHDRGCPMKDRPWLHP